MTNETMTVVVPDNNLTKALCRKLIYETCRGLTWSIVPDGGGDPIGTATVGFDGFDEPVDGWWRACAYLGSLPQSLWPARDSVNKILDGPEGIIFHFAVTDRAEVLWRLNGRVGVLILDDLAFPVGGFFS